LQKNLPIKIYFEMLNFENLLLFLTLTFNFKFYFF
jgi:hypothetical protein